MLRRCDNDLDQWGGGRGGGAVWPLIIYGQNGCFKARFKPPHTGPLNGGRIFKAISASRVPWGDGCLRYHGEYGAGVGAVAGLLPLLLCSFTLPERLQCDSAGEWVSNHFSVAKVWWAGPRVVEFAIWNITLGLGRVYGFKNLGGGWGLWISHGDDLWIHEMVKVGKVCERALPKMDYCIRFSGRQGALHPGRYAFLFEKHSFCFNSVEK